MQITLYKLKKRENSTRVPGSSDGNYPVTGFIFEPCSIIEPSIKINWGLQTAPYDYNYCYIPEFGRFYHVENWTFNKGFWTFTGVCDPLASWKADILASTQYVVRSASSFDGEIVDNLYPCKAKTQYVEKNCIPEAGSVFTDNYGTGCYILSVISQEGGTIGGNAYYLMGNTAFTSLYRVLLNTVDWLEVDPSEISENLQKMFFNPMDYLVGAMWFPMSVQRMALESGATPISGDLPYGQWQLPFTGVAYQLPNNGSSYVQRYNVEIPDHPLASQRGKYLNISPYTRRWLNFPPFGRTALDTTTLIGRTTLQIVCRIDMITGRAQLTAGGLENAVCIYENAQLGVPIQITQITTDFISGVQTLGNVAGSAMSLVGQAAALNPYVGAATAGGLLAGAGAAVSAAGGLGAVGNMIQAAFNDVAKSGSNGSLVGYGLKPTMGSLFSIPVDDYVAERGRPLCKPVKLSTLTGYTLCEDPDLQISATAEEIRAIKRYLASGFYIE